MENNKYLFVLLILLILVGCNGETSKSEEIMNKGNGETIDESEQVAEESKTIEFINDDHDIHVYGKLSEHGDMISDFVIRNNKGEVGPFKWNQRSLRDPIIYFEDINQDNQNEIVFINILDHGTGIILSEAHVITINSTEAIVVPIQNIIKEKVRFSGKKVFLGDSLIYESSKYGDLKAYYDDWINYKVVDGKLIGGVRIGDGRAEQYAGYLEVEYGFSEGKYNVKEIRHIDDSKMQTEGTPLQFRVLKNY